MSATSFDLHTLASSNERMREMFRWLGSLPAATNVSRGMDVRELEGTLTIEQWVEAELPGDVGICFWLETRIATAGCVVEASVLHQSEAGQSMFRQRLLVVEGERDYSSAIQAATDSLWDWREEGVRTVVANGR